MNQLIKKYNTKAKKLMIILSSIVIFFASNNSHALYSDFNPKNKGKEEILPKDNLEPGILVKGKKVFIINNGKEFDIDSLEFKNAVKNWTNNIIYKITDYVRGVFNDPQLRHFIITKLIMSAEDTKNLKAIKNIEMLAEPLMNQEIYSKREFYYKTFDMLKEDNSK